MWRLGEFLERAAEHYETKEMKQQGSSSSSKASDPMTAPLVMSLWPVWYASNWLSWPISQARATLFNWLLWPTPQASATLSNCLLHEAPHALIGCCMRDRRRPVPHYLTRCCTQRHTL